MGWTIVRPDGTYRFWSRNDQSGELGPGEVWQEMASPPVVGPSTVEQDTDAVRDAYVVAKNAVQGMVDDPTTIAKARTAIVRLGQCLEELLKALNRRIL